MIRAGCVAAALLLPLLAAAYPIDAFEDTGIRRLDFYDRAQRGEVRGRQLPAGARLTAAAVQPRLPAAEDDLPAADPAFSAQLRALLGDDRDRYGISVLDLSDAARPVYGAHNADWRQNVGSVGKLLVATALYGELARLWPDDIPRRAAVLRETPVVADDIILYDRHKVPLWDPAAARLEHRPLVAGDRGSLLEFVDWMMSASSNAAAAMVMKELILLRHGGTAYPGFDRAAAYAAMDPAARGRLLAAAMDAALAVGGIDSRRLRQGSVFTSAGKKQVAGRQSWGTAGELTRLLYRMERGVLVDRYSSRELKRMMYMTQKRIRYASHPVLNGAAVYFKSGSLYSCRPEPGFRCQKYAGNRVNLLTSVAIVESPAGAPRLHYLVSVISNVLRKNSAFEHQALAAQVHQLIRRRNAGAGT